MADSHREQEEAYCGGLELIAVGSDRPEGGDGVPLHLPGSTDNGPRGLKQSMTTVLLVEADQPLRLIYRTNLEWAGYTVIEAEDGPTAINLAAQAPPEVALIAILLPGMSGWSIAA
jgi:hypothetical protein